MFKFQEYTSNTNYSSTGVSHAEYENCLIQVLCLPISCNFRELSLPLSSSLSFLSPNICGVNNADMRLSREAEYQMATEPLNEMCFKMNTVNASATSEDTLHETNFSIHENAHPSDEAYDLTNELVFSPAKRKSCKAKIYSNATVVDMATQEKEKKGLSDFDFKLIKVHNPETQRTKTTFL